MLAGTRDDGYFHLAGLFISTNSGASWTNISSQVGGYGHWRALASNGDGTHLAAAGSSGYPWAGTVFVSTDSGETWTDVNMATSGDLHWSNDGSRLYLVNSSGSTFFSTNNGASWTENLPPVSDSGANPWHAAFSDDGTHILEGSTGNPNGYGLWISTDSGATWNEVRPTGESVPKSWYAVASNADGTKLLASDGTHLYVSTNEAASWSEVRPDGGAGESWNRLSFGKDSSVMLAGTSGRLYVSSNDGVSWQEIQPAGNVDAPWSAEVESGAGLHGIAGHNDGFTGGRLYVSPPPPVAISGFSPSNGSINVDVHTTLNMTLSQSATPVSGKNVRIKKQSDNSAVATISVTGSQVVVNGTDVTITPSSPLPGGENLYVDVDSGAFMAAGDRASVSVSGMTSWKFSTPLSSTAAFNWTETQPNGANDDPWKAVASSSDGNYLLAAGSATGSSWYGGRMYLSTDRGSTWTETGGSNVGSDRDWRSVSISNDGTRLIAGVGSGFGGDTLYISTDSGANWSPMSPSGSTNTWSTVLVNGAGTVFFAGNGSRLYTSTNDGVDWTETQPAGDQNYNWQTIASSTDGVNLIAGVNGGRLYISSNSGTDWSEATPAGSTNQSWQSVSSSSDGSVLVAVVNGGALYLSSDSGATWTAASIFGETNPS